MAYRTQNMLRKIAAMAALRKIAEAAPTPGAAAASAAGKVKAPAAAPKRDMRASYIQQPLGYNGISSAPRGGGFSTGARRVAGALFNASPIGMGWRGLKGLYNAGQWMGNKLFGTGEMPAGTKIQYPVSPRVQRMNAVLRGQQANRRAPVAGNKVATPKGPEPDLTPYLRHVKPEEFDNPEYAEALIQDARERWEADNAPVGGRLYE